MTTDEELKNEPNLLRCSVKKATATFANHVLLVSYAVVISAIVAIAVASAWYIANGAYYMGVEYAWVATAASVAIVQVAGFLLSIAWYWYVAIAIPLVYIGHGVIWCIQREFTDDEIAQANSYIEVAGEALLAGIWMASAGCSVMLYISEATCGIERGALIFVLTVTSVVFFIVWAFYVYVAPTIKLLDMRKRRGNHDR